MLIGQACTAIVQRGADIPGRPLDGGQAADDRSDRAILAGGLACFDEVPGIFRRPGSVRLLAGRRSRLLLGRRRSGRIVVRHVAISLASASTVWRTTSALPGPLAGELPQVVIQR